MAVALATIAVTAALFVRSARTDTTAAQQRASQTRDKFCTAVENGRVALRLPTVMKARCWP
ncbi:hypothetical protein [Streptomyces roseifaciens]|uniref:hypothetical protein n=1 Tax=Streptomyces roseifaciens TaxID=1488406 RepID=UPI0011876CF2|nr:hypothetical protein [Streptomyces roseifaciens]